MSGVPHDPWHSLASRTSARVGLGRAGASLPTREVLSFALAHAQARDAVHARLDRAALAAEFRPLGLQTIDIESDAADRQTYLRRPDFGRRLSAASEERLAALTCAPCDIAIMIGDGLSALAVQGHASSLLNAFMPLMAKRGLTMGPIILAEGARVALGDSAGALLNARLVMVLIGERPGLSSADSLGVYLTYAPRQNMTDAERNCVSNIRPEGLAPIDAARKIAWLVTAALARQLTGVSLKDESDDPILVPPEGSPRLR
jgi:ethanolamine ammonia-lyase small subunit